MKIINFFKLIIIVVFITIFVSIFTVNRIKRTNEKNDSIHEQKQLLEQYVSSNQTSQKVEEFINKYLQYIGNKKSKPENVLDFEFYGEENDNLKVIYTVDDQEQFDYYKNSLNDIKNKLNKEKDYYLTYESDDESICKIIIECN